MKNGLAPSANLEAIFHATSLVKDARVSLKTVEAKTLKRLSESALPNNALIDRLTANTLELSECCETLALRDNALVRQEQALLSSLDEPVQYLARQVEASRAETDCDQSRLDDLDDVLQAVRAWQTERVRLCYDIVAAVSDLHALTRSELLSIRRTIPIPAEVRDASVLLDAVLGSTTGLRSPLCGPDTTPLIVKQLRIVIALNDANVEAETARLYMSVVEQLHVREHSYDKAMTALNNIRDAYPAELSKTNMCDLLDSLADQSTRLSAACESMFDLVLENQRLHSKVVTAINEICSLLHACCKLCCDIRHEPSALAVLEERQLTPDMLRLRQAAIAKLREAVKVLEPVKHGPF